MQPNRDTVTGPSLMIRASSVRGGPDPVGLRGGKSIGIQNLTKIRILNPAVTAHAQTVECMEVLCEQAEKQAREPVSFFIFTK